MCASTDMHSTHPLPLERAPHGHEMRLPDKQCVPLRPPDFPPRLFGKACVCKWGAYLQQERGSRQEAGPQRESAGESAGGRSAIVGQVQCVEHSQDWGDEGGAVGWQKRGKGKGAGTRACLGEG